MIWVWDLEEFICLMGLEGGRLTRGLVPHCARGTSFFSAKISSNQRPSGPKAVIVKNCVLEFSAHVYQNGVIRVEVGTWGGGMFIFMDKSLSNLASVNSPSFNSLSFTKPRLRPP